MRKTFTGFPGEPDDPDEPWGGWPAGGPGELQPVDDVPITPPGVPRESTRELGRDTSLIPPPPHRREPGTRQPTPGAAQAAQPPESDVEPDLPIAEPEQGEDSGGPELPDDRESNPPEPRQPDPLPGEQDTDRPDQPTVATDTDRSPRWRLWRADRSELSQLTREEWAARGEALRVAIDGRVGDWQEQAVTDAPSAEVWHDMVRRQAAADSASKVDVYLLRDGAVVAVVPSEVEQDLDAKPFRRLFVASVEFVAWQVVDAGVGLPVSTFVLPKDVPATAYYVVGLGLLRLD